MSKKSVLGIFAVLTLVAVSFAVLYPAGDADADPVGGDCGPTMTWSYDSVTESLTIDGTGNMYDYQATEDAPWYNLPITSLTIEAGVEYAGMNAFNGCDSTLRSLIILSESVNLDYAFNGIEYGVTELTTYSSSILSAFNLRATVRTLTLGMEDIEMYAVNVWGIETLTILESVRTIGYNAFTNCNMLSLITIESEDLFIDTYAFYLYKNLSEYSAHNCYVYTDTEGFLDEYVDQDTDLIYNPGSLYTVTMAGEHPIYGATTNMWRAEPGDTVTLLDWSDVEYVASMTYDGESVFETFTMPSNDVYIKVTFGVIPGGVCGDVTWTYHEQSKTLNISGQGAAVKDNDNSMWVPYDIRHVVIGEGVTSIGSTLFSGMNDLESVSIPSTMTSIGQFAFKSCSSLTSLTIPANLTSIDEGAFIGCTVLEIIVDDDNSVFAMVDGALIEEKKNLMTYLSKGAASEYNIPFGVEHIAESAFENNTSLESVTIPSSVTSIGGRAFLGASALRTVSIHSTVEGSIGTSAFSLSESSVTCQVITDKNGLLDGFGDLTVFEYIVTEPHTVTLIIISTEGVMEDSFEALPGEKIMIPGPREGRDMTVECNDSPFSGDHFIMGTEDVRVEVTYTSKKYAVVFIANDDIVHTTSSSIGGTIDIPTNPSKSADLYNTYTFNGWSGYPSDGILTADMVQEGTVTFIAQFIPTPIQYTIKFIAEGSVVSTTTATIGGTIMKPVDPFKSENLYNTYEFDGWSGYPADGILTDDMITGSIEFIAQFIPTPIQYTIKFIAEGSVVSTTKTTIDEEITKPTVNPSKPQDLYNTYTFGGWSGYPANGILMEDMVVGPIEFTAVFISTPIEYTITFVSEGNVVSTTKTTIGGTITKPSDPTKSADLRNTYAFGVWSGYPVDGKLTESMVTGSIEFNAVFISTPIEYTVTFVSEGNVVSTTTATIGGTITKPSNPSKATDIDNTYAFSEWRGYPADGKLTESMVTAQIVFTAEFVETSIERTMVFKVGGTEIYRTTAKIGDVITKPSDPAKSADLRNTYAFGGWSGYPADGILTGEMVAGSLVFDAQFIATPIEYTISFVVEGKIVLTTTALIGGTISTPSDSTKDGDIYDTYTFNGWSGYPADGKLTESMVAGPIVFTAKFLKTQTEHTIVFNVGESEVYRTTAVIGGKISMPVNPVKEDDLYLEYTFSVWMNNHTHKMLYEYVLTEEMVSGTVGFLAIFKESNRMYTFEFKADGKVISTLSLKIGDKISVPPLNPKKDPDMYNTYVFRYWSNLPEDGIVTEEMVKHTRTFEAFFEPAAVKYTVKFVDRDNVVQEYEIVIGEFISKPQSIPVKVPTDQYNYTFVAWGNYNEDMILTEKMVLTGNTTFRAGYTEVLRDYIVTFNGYDSEVVYNVKYGQTITLPETTPTKASTNMIKYEFKEWSGYSVETTVTGNMQFEAEYKSAVREDVDYEEFVEDEKITIDSNDTSEVEISNNVIKIWKAKVEETAVDVVEVVTTHGSIAMGLKVLDYIDNNAEDEGVKVYIKWVDAEDLIDETAEYTIKNRPIYDISMGNIKSFGGETVTVSIVYDLQVDEASENLVVYSINESGTLERHATTYENGSVVFYTAHFSYYCIAYVVPDDNGTSVEPNNNDALRNMIGLIAITIVSLLAALYFIRQQ